MTKKLEIVKETDMLGNQSYTIRLNDRYVPGSFSNSFAEVTKYYMTIKSKVIEPKKEVIKSEILE